VYEYVKQFSALVDQLVSYDANTNCIYYAMHFVNGLCEEIKYVVMIQCPSTLDTACALALVLEEVM
jgi:hypothetical protein